VKRKEWGEDILKGDKRRKKEAKAERAFSLPGVNQGEGATKILKGKRKDPLP